MTLAKQWPQTAEAVAAKGYVVNLSVNAHGACCSILHESRRPFEIYRTQYAGTLEAAFAACYGQMPVRQPSRPNHRRPLRRLRVLWKLSQRDIRRRAKCECNRLADDHTCLDCERNPWVEAW